MPEALDLARIECEMAWIWGPQRREEWELPFEQIGQAHEEWQSYILTAHSDVKA